MNDKNKKGMTLEKLAGMVSRRFDDMEEKMVTKEEFRVLERKVDKIDFQVDQVHEILDHGEKDFLGLQRRVQVLEKVNKPHHI